MILSDLQGRGTIHGVVQIGGGGGVTDYDELTNRPSINTHVITGSKTGHDYDLANLEDVLIKELNPTITPGVNYPRLEHFKDKDNQIYIVKYPAFTGGISGLVPQALNPSGKVLNDSGIWVDLPTPTETYEVIWDYITDNNNEVKYGSQTYNLHKSIDEYKRIILQMITHSLDPGIPEWNQANQCNIDMYVLKNGYRPYRTVYTSYGTRSIALYFDSSSDHNILTTHCDDNSYNGMTYIYGVK